MASIFKRTGRKNEPYTIQYTDHLGNRLTEKGFTDKGLRRHGPAKSWSSGRMGNSGPGFTSYRT